MKENTTALMRSVAKQMAENYTKSEVPLYGASLRLPEREAVIGLINDCRKLFFPAYYGDQSLVELPPEEYAALLLGRMYRNLLRQVTLALPERWQDKEVHFYGFAVSYEGEASATVYIGTAVPLAKKQPSSILNDGEIRYEKHDKNDIPCRRVLLGHPTLSETDQRRFGDSDGFCQRR